MSENVLSKYLVPRFPTETEEADWWYENRHVHIEEFMQLKEEGKLKGWWLCYRLEPLTKPKTEENAGPENQ
ncbi:MAG: hypothetical protein V4555_13885 [Acidobacteriota bacterium]